MSRSAIKLMLQYIPGISDRIEIATLCRPIFIDMLLDDRKFITD